VLNTLTNRGYFLENLEDFDSAFFGISPMEAERMDPQQRLALEVAWEALENAGISPQSLSGSNTAVFIGVNSDDYSKLLLEDLPDIDAWMGIGTAYCGVANRISYILNLHGPSMAVDAACASSLVAIDQGKSAILRGDSMVAIAGGVNAICGPGLTCVLEKAGALSSDGRCRPFDDKANGYGRGEGAAIIILKDMSAAVRDGDNIIAVLKGSAVGQDGRTNGIMAPNAEAQESVALRALNDARIDPSNVDFVEAHATGTPLGDPTEIEALSRVYGKGRDLGSSCFIGSVKANIGHLEAAAGAVSFIKAVKAVQNGFLAPQANLTTLTRKVTWSETGLHVVRDAQKWPASEHPHCAAVCSYGYGGTVSHAIIQEYSYPLPLSESADPTGPHVLLLSAPQEKGVIVQAKAYEQWISTHGRLQNLSSIVTTLATRRSFHNHRAAFVVSDHDDAADKLQSFSNGCPREWTATQKAISGDSAEARGVVWAFSGHGAQWPGMAKYLLSVPAFYEAVAPLDAIVEEELGFSALQAMGTGELGTTDRIQVITYLMHVGLSSVLYSKGLKCDAVFGHSVGEIAAAVVAGCITEAEGTILVAKRAKSYRQFMGSGAMLLVNMSSVEVRKYLDPQSNLMVAIYSSPSSCVVSGTKSEIEAFEAAVTSRGINTFRVQADIAFHHSMLDALAEPLGQELERLLAPRPPTIKTYSTSMADPHSSAPRDAQYWIHNMTKPVLLTSAVTAAIEDGFRLFLEVSSHPIISQSIREILIDSGVETFIVTNTMFRKQPPEKSLVHSIAQLHCAGAVVEWAQQMKAPWAPDVPVTTWCHKPTWKHVSLPHQHRSVLHDVDQHALLGQRISIAGDDRIIYMTTMDERTKPFPCSHPVLGCEIVPAAVVLNTFLLGAETRALYDVKLNVPIPTTESRKLQVILQGGQIKLCSACKEEDDSTESGRWVVNATSSWKETNEESIPLEQCDLEAVKSSISTKLGDNFSVDYLTQVGVSAMGFPWKVTQHYGNESQMIACLDAAPEGKATGNPNSWAPILDSATSIASTLFWTSPRLRMPTSIRKVTIHSRQPPPRMSYLIVSKVVETPLTTHVSICDENGRIIVTIEAMRFAEVENCSFSDTVDGLVHHIAWPPASYCEQPLAFEQIVLVGDDKELLDVYGEQIKRKQINSTTTLCHSDDLHNLLQDATDALRDRAILVTYIPGHVPGLESVQAASLRFALELLAIVKFVVKNSLSSKVCVLTERVAVADSPTALAHSPLHGLSRIINSEHPDIWAGLVDLEVPIFPIEVIKYVRGAANVRMADGIPRTAILRPLPREYLLPPEKQNSLMPHHKGTYLITGGLGALGLEVADFLVERGARRLILVSRRSLPPRHSWTAANEKFPALSPIFEKVKTLEAKGATVRPIAADISAPSAFTDLSAAIEALSFPPVVGVVHAAGVLEDQFVLSTTQSSFQKVVAPKVAGAITLHRMFPPTSLDFMVLFSSCGQLFGLPGQASYASGNAFLDKLATHRRRQGDNTVSMQWTCWRGLGMGSHNDFIATELATRGITDISLEEAFQAWEHTSRYDVDQVVVLRSVAFEPNEPVPNPLLAGIATRKAAVADASSLTASSESPRPGPKGRTFGSKRECEKYFMQQISQIVSQLLQLETGEIDSKVPLRNLGLDSVMTVQLRSQLLKDIGIQVPATLAWNLPTVSHLADWCSKNAWAVDAG
jgi:6-methylsalicylic acid synthase